jgi:hypothetical protein
MKSVKKIWDVIRNVLRKFNPRIDEVKRDYMEIEDNEATSLKEMGFLYLKLQQTNV